MKRHALTAAPVRALTPSFNAGLVAQTASAAQQQKPAAFGRRIEKAIPRTFVMQPDGSLSEQCVAREFDTANYL